MFEGIKPLETVISWDIGQVQDFSAIAVVQAHQPYVINEFEDRVDLPIQITIGSMQRLPLGTDYRQQRQYVLDVWRSLRNDLAVFSRHAPTPVILMDITGVGRGIFDEIRHDASELPSCTPVITGIQWTAGHQVNHERQVWNVPKNDAVQAMIIVAQNGQLRIRADQPFAADLKNELRNFRRKVSAAGNDQYSAAKENIHDDLVMAISQAVWFIRKMNGSKPKAIPRPF